MAVFRNEVDCRDIRRRILHLAHQTSEGHVPSSLSIVEMLVAVYERMRPNLDVFILSKGHASFGYYAVLEAFNLASPLDLDLACMPSGKYGGHPSSFSSDAIHFSTGSLGHGLAVACGIAYMAKNSETSGFIYTLIGDQECNEGSIWESALIASNFKLSNLVAMIDVNNSDARSMPMGDLQGKWESFGWNALRVSGHSLSEIRSALDKTSSENIQPTVLICETIKGKGISFMENSPEWHHKIISDDVLDAALKELHSA